MVVTLRQNGKLAAGRSNRDRLRVAFEGGGESGYSVYSPDLPGVVAAGSKRQETEVLMREAMAEHIGLLRKPGQPVPEPSETDSVTILNPATA